MMNYHLVETYPEEPWVQTRSFYNHESLLEQLKDEHYAEGTGVVYTVVVADSKSLEAAKTFIADQARRIFT